jgi:hypothetical protein
MISKQWTAHTYQNNEIRKYGFKNVLNTLLLTVHLPRSNRKYIALALQLLAFLQSCTLLYLLRVARKFVNSCVNSSNCSFVNLEYFMKYNFVVFPIIVFIEYKNECKFIILKKKPSFSRRL